MSTKDPALVNLPWKGTTNMISTNQAARVDDMVVEPDASLPLERYIRVRQENIEARDRLRAKELEVERNKQVEVDEKNRRNALDKIAKLSAWDELILPEQIKDELRTYCQVLREHEFYSKQGIRLPKGLVFHGPPGVGKTETARFLSKQSGFSFVSLSTADLKVGWIGQAAVKSQNTFAEARKNAPCMIFIDELDAACPPRGHSNDSVIGHEVTSQILQEMDGLHSNDHAIFVFAATNRLDMIDPAVLQRFTEHVQIGLPGPEERMKLIDLFIGELQFYDLELEDHGYQVIEYLSDDGEDKHVLTLHGSQETWPLESDTWSAASDEALEIMKSKLCLGPYSILARLALATEGRSGRELKNLVTKATMRAIRRSSDGGVRRAVELHQSDFICIT
jgi:SpoVK/Ycf46/Vps4 family AAA+-type ATPase